MMPHGALDFALIVGTIIKLDLHLCNIMKNVPEAGAVVIHKKVLGKFLAYLLCSSVCTAIGVDGGPEATVVAVIVTR